MTARTARRNPILRSAVALAVLAVAAAAVILARGMQAVGTFASMKPGFSGTCSALPVPGVSDIEIDEKDNLAFLSMFDVRNPGPRDGIYALNLSGPPKLVRLSGTPPDFHPRGLGLYRMPGGAVRLMAVNHHNTDRYSIDSFEVAHTGVGVALTAVSTVESGLLVDPEDVVATGADSFYVSNDVTGHSRPMRLLESYGIWAGGNIVYFNGSAFREAVNGISGARGLALTPDGGHVLVAAVTGRSILSLSREPFTGNLSQAGSLSLPAGPDRLSLDAHGDLWAGAYANLSSWRSFGRDPKRRSPSQIFHVTLAGGVPQSAEQIYGNDGGEIAAAAVGAVAGKRLLIGSPLDGKLLDCRMP